LFLARLPWLDLFKAVTDLHFKDALVIRPPFRLTLVSSLFSLNALQLFVLFLLSLWVFRAPAFCFCSGLVVVVLQGTVLNKAPFVPVYVKKVNGRDFNGLGVCLMVPPMGKNQHSLLS
jgi:hypothetical protein